MPRTLDLTPKQRRFVEEYLLDLNAGAAARRAGYSSTTVAGLPAVKEAIQAEMDARSVRTHVRLDKVLIELQRLALFDPAVLFDPDTGLLKPINEIPEDARRAIASIETDELFEGFGEERTQIGVTRKVKLLDRNSALDKLMRHLGAYKDRLELTGNVTLREMLPGAKLPEPKDEPAPEITLDDELSGDF